jgi:hypothetical protein
MVPSLLEKEKLDDENGKEFRTYNADAALRAIDRAAKTE